MTSIIKTSVLRAAVLSAFDLLRYKVQFGTQKAGDDIAVVPTSITLDLSEHDDDLFDGETPKGWNIGPGTRVKVAASGERGVVTGPFRAGRPAWLVQWDKGGWLPIFEDKLAPDDDEPEWGGPVPLEDEHGPAIPAQTGKASVYEFALQDAVYLVNGNLSNIALCDAPDLQAAAHADWVHVFDRSTGERRTLKRPTDPAVVEGLETLEGRLRANATRSPVDTSPPKRDA